jgi:hypothetical protein
MERLQRVRLKVERAKKHISDLDEALRIFGTTKPYEITAKRNPQLPNVIQYYVATAGEIPSEIPLICGDALQNLRSALDHLARQLVEVAGNSPNTDTVFPIFESAKEYEGGHERKVKLMRPDAIKAIAAVKPYKGGNDSLWRLNKLNIIDKHRLLLASGGACIASDLLKHFARKIPALAPLAGHGYWMFSSPEDIVCPIKAGDVLFEDVASEVNQNLKFAFVVAFTEPEVAEREPLLETVKGIFDLVDNLISDFAPLLR